MQSATVTPRFRNLSINGLSQVGSTSFSFNDNEPKEEHKSEAGCFMCRQANVYLNPIGMQQERRVARRHPPPLTRAQIEELSEKKHLTKREVRLLLQCYFPEIKNVKYFQLHKYHSCCYDPKHLSLCKNHITAMQHEREHVLNHHFQKSQHDENHSQEYQRDGGHQNRVSFVRIKIEPTNGIPTRFLGPTALPESLADMLIKQVNRFENKTRPVSFNSQSQIGTQMYNIKRIEQPNGMGNGASSLSEHLGNLQSDDDEDDNGFDSSDDNIEEEMNNLNTANTNIHGSHGKISSQSLRKNERQLQLSGRKEEEQEQEKEEGEAKSTVHGDLVVEDIEELTPLFVHEKQPLKKKKRKKRTKKQGHPKPKLNHWEQLAVDQAKQEACGCRHHVRRREADQIVYDWCRCKNHSHKDLKEKPKTIPPPPRQPPPSPKKPKVEKKTIGINTTEATTTELALAYDPTAVDYDVIQEVLYFRTSSGRLVKPEMRNGFGFTDTLNFNGRNRNKPTPVRRSPIFVTPRAQSVNGENQQPKKRFSIVNSPGLSTRDSFSNSERLLTTNGLMPVYEIPDSFKTKTGDMYGNEEEEEEEDDDEEEIEDFTPPKYLPENPSTTFTQSAAIPLSKQKSSKPTYINQKPTPNFERETSLLANRRWYDQALGDQNLLTVHDGQYGLLAGTSAEEDQLNNQLLDDEHVAEDGYRNKSNCTIS